MAARAAPTPSPMARPPSRPIALTCLISVPWSFLVVWAASLSRQNHCAIWATRSPIEFCRRPSPKAPAKSKLPGRPPISPWAKASLPRLPTGSTAQSEVVTAEVCRRRAVVSQNEGRVKICKVSRHIELAEAAPAPLPVATTEAKSKLPSGAGVAVVADDGGEVKVAAGGVGCGIAGEGVGGAPSALANPEASGGVGDAVGAVGDREVAHARCGGRGACRTTRTRRSRWRNHSDRTAATGRPGGPRCAASPRRCPARLPVRRADHSFSVSHGSSLLPLSVRPRELPADNAAARLMVAAAPEAHQCADRPIWHMGKHLMFASK